MSQQSGKNCYYIWYYSKEVTKDPKRKVSGKDFGFGSEKGNGVGLFLCAQNDQEMRKRLSEKMLDVMADIDKITENKIQELEKKVAKLQKKIKDERAESGKIKKWVKSLTNETGESK